MDTEKRADKRLKVDHTILITTMVDKPAEPGKTTTESIATTVALEVLNGSSSGDVDFLSLSHDDEWNSGIANLSMDTDELPTFEIRGYAESALSRSPSPIDFAITCEDNSSILNNSIPTGEMVCRTPQKAPTNLPIEEDPTQSSPEALAAAGYVSLSDINAQINPPSDGKFMAETTYCLETIYEGVLLEIRHRRLSVIDLCTMVSQRKVLEKEKYVHRVAEPFKVINEEKTNAEGYAHATSASCGKENRKRRRLRSGQADSNDSGSPTNTKALLPGLVKLTP